jgi:hypothetical protein
MHEVLHYNLGCSICNSDLSIIIRVEFSREDVERIPASVAQLLHDLFEFNQHLIFLFIIQTASVV